MAAFGFSSARANVKVAGIKSWKLISAGDTSGAIDLGKLYDGKISVAAITQKDSYQRSYPIAADVNISAKMLGTHKTTVLELLGSLYGPANHEVEMINGGFLLGSVAATNQLGLGWRFDSSKDYDGIRYVEVISKGKMILTGTEYDLDDLFGSATGITTDAPAGNLTAWSAVGYNPAGMSAFETRNAGESNWETLGLFRNGRLVCETIDYMDNHQCNCPFAIRFSVSAEMLQTSTTELELLDSLSAGTPDFKVTLADGAAFTFADNCGVSWSYANDVDADGVAYITVSGDGIVLLSDWAGLVA